MILFATDCGGVEEQGVHGHGRRDGGSLTATLDA
jgi:hypothetical protein